MKKIYMLFALFISLALVAKPIHAAKKDVKEDLTTYVEPRIGTAHCRWFHFTPGAMPFGMAKVAPSTNGHLGNKWGWEATGYDYRDTSIEGFPCLHEFQVGGVVLMPTVGQLRTTPGALNMQDNGYRSRFDREDEVATSGYYSVMLKDYNIKVELTATNRVAFQRYTFPKSTESRIIFDIGNQQGESGAVKDAHVKLNEDGTIEGWVITLPEYVKKYQPEADVKMYFYAKLDKRPTGWGTFIGKNIKANSKSESGVGAGLYLTFNTKMNEKVVAKVGLSYTSIANARLNMAHEAAKLSFDAARRNAHDSWNSYLSRIRVETPVKSDKVKFYTGLYHALLGRGLASDVNGAYPRNDGSVGQLELKKDGTPLHNLYNTDAAWGIQWNLSQLWSLAYPEYYSDYISSHLQVYKDAGWLADGLACSRYVSGVGSNLLTAAIAGAYQCGIRDFDLNAAYEASIKNELDGTNRPMGAGKMDTQIFVEKGYSPHQEKAEGPNEAFLFSASHTLEYSYSAWAVAQWAKVLNKQEDYNKLMYLSKGWERLYDSTTNFIRPKYANGEFVDNFDPMQVWRGFQEGNSWQYTFYVPHDIKGLISKVGTKSFTQRLDSIFTLSQKKNFSGGTEVGAFAGLQTLYNHGNQPCLHISWLFNDSGKPSLTQKWVRTILDEFYGVEGVHGYGYGQDEDQGQLGAWYVISSMGLFDVKGLTAINPTVGLASPLFNKITIELNPRYYKGKQFVITTENNKKENIYVKQFMLNGKVLNGVNIPFKSITDGGSLHIVRDSAAKDNY